LSGVALPLENGAGWCLWQQGAVLVGVETDDAPVTEIQERASNDAGIVLHALQC
jgi:hypothetical protein